jgi:hypothetical protein
MDMDALKSNVKEAIKLMPPALQIDFGKLFTGVEKHLPFLEANFPKVWSLMANDIMSLSAEFSMGIIDKDALSKAMHEAFGECGIGLPDVPTKPKAP